MHHIHLDPVGGIAGDMFVAALLHACPAHAAAAVAAAAAVSGVPCRTEPRQDGALTGLRFIVEHEHQPHGHAHWSAIRARISAADLPDAARQHAIGIFEALAAA